MTTPPLVSIIGAGACDEGTAELAYAVGGELARRGVGICCGGLGGVMREAARGQRDAGGFVLGILPGETRHDANEFVDVAVATGLSHMRNYLVVLNGLAAIAVEGGNGTLSEIGLAMKIGRTVVALGRHSRTPGVVPASDASEAVNLALQAIGVDTKHA